MKQSLQIIAYQFLYLFILICFIGCVSNTPPQSLFLSPPKLLPNYHELTQLTIEKPVIDCIGLSLNQDIQDIYAHHIMEQLYQRFQYQNIYHIVSDQLHYSKSFETIEHELNQMNYQIASQNKPSNSNNARIIISASINLGSSNNDPFVNFSTIMMDSKGKEYFIKLYEKIKSPHEKKSFKAFSSYDHHQMAQKSASLFVAQLLKDIMPQTEMRPLKPNPDGDQKGIKMIELCQFDKALNHYTKIIQQQEDLHAKAIRGIEKDFQIHKKNILAKEKNEKRKKTLLIELMQDKNKHIIDQGKTLSFDYENYALVLESLGEIEKAISMYEKACQAFSDNQSARDAYNRLIYFKTINIADIE